MTGLLLAAFWHPSENYQLLLQFVVCAGAIFVAWEAYSAEKYLWALGFVAIGVLFNPVQPLLFSRELFLGLDLLSLATFLMSLAVLKGQSRVRSPSRAS
jgi:hypothetical protein